MVHNPLSPLNVLQKNAKHCNILIVNVLHFFINAKQSTRKHVFLVKSDTKKMMFQNFISLQFYAPFCYFRIDAHFAIYKPLKKRSLCKNQCKST